MNFEFSQDQQLLRETARRFLQDKCPRSRVRRSTESATRLDRDLWREFAEMGWTGVTIPEEHGGLGMGYLEQAVLAEEIGRSLAPVPFSSSTYLATEAILLGGSDEAKARYLPELASGAIIGTYGFQERVQNSGRHDVATEFRDGKLYGAKLPVLDGDIADIAVVSCLVGTRYRMAVVDLRGEGVSRTPVEALDLTRGLAEIRFDGAAAELLDAGDDDLLDTLCNRAAALLAFEQIGGAEQCLHDARDYSLSRFAFGRQIGSFQSIKHKLADLVVALELARSNAYYAIWALSANSPELPAAAAAAHIGATKAFQLCARESLHVHGGMGYTWEFDCHLFMRRSIVAGLMLGPIRNWKHALVDRITAGKASHGL